MYENYKCIHEELLQEHNKQIEALNVKSKYKEDRIDELYLKMEKMETKLDKLNENVNQLLLQSKQGDTDLELRLKAIETELALQKETAKNNHNKQQANYTKLATIGGIVSIGLVVLDLFLKYGVK